MNDDLEEDLTAEDGFDEFSQKSGLSDTLAHPAAKIVVVLAVLAVIIGIMLYFNQEEVETAPSFIPGGTDLTSVPGTDGEVSQVYNEAIEEVNEDNLVRAIEEGTSAIPIPVSEPETRLKVPEVEEEPEDPLHRWRVLQEERLERKLKSKEVEVEPVTVLDAEQQSEAINALSESMTQQMESVLASINEDKTFTTRTLISYPDEEQGPGAALGLGGGNGGAPNGGAFEEDSEETIVIAAGQIYYGQTLLEANSDVPGSVLAQVVSGPLKGWRLIGEFTVLEDIGMLAITFNVAVNEEGKQYTVDAVMLNPKTTLPAMRTYINRRYLQRVVLPAAAAFVEGFAEAIADSGRTTVTVSGETVIQDEEELNNDQEVATGVEEAAEEISEVLDDAADVPPQIIIKAGTPIGIFFTANVVDSESDI